MEEIARKGRKGKMDMQSEIAKRLAVACRGYIPYTEYRGPGPGSGKNPCMVKNIFWKDTRKKWKEKKR